MVRLSIAISFLTILVSSAPAVAHPHIFAVAKAEISFDRDGRVAAVRNIWTFDEGFSAFAIADLDEDGDGEIGATEFQTLAEENMEALAESDFFTRLTADGQKIAVDPPRDYANTLDAGLLTLAFTLPLSEPVKPTGSLSIGIFDPGYSVAFEFAEEAPLYLVDAPSECTATLHRPEELDAVTMELLAALPQDKKILPPELAEIAIKLGNHIAVSCD